MSERYIGLDLLLDFSERRLFSLIKDFFQDVWFQIVIYKSNNIERF